MESNGGEELDSVHRAGERGQRREDEEEEEEARSKGARRGSDEERPPAGKVEEERRLVVEGERARGRSEGGGPAARRGR